MHIQNNNTTYTKNGFIATTAIVVLAFGSMAFILATSHAALWYADSVTARQHRIQALLNERACIDTGHLVHAKDYFMSASVYVSEFDCTIHSSQ